MFFSPAELLEFDHWASTRSFESIATIPAANEADRTAALDLMAHVAASKRNHAHRFREMPLPGPAFPKGLSAEQVVAELEGARRLWVECLATLPEGGLDTPFEFVFTNNAPRRFRVIRRTLLGHSILHGMYHRGQLASIVRRGGGTPASSDLLFWPGGGTVEINAGP